MTARVRVTGEVPSLSLIFLNGRLDVDQWPTQLTEDGQYWWQRYLVCGHPSFDDPEYLNPDIWLRNLIDLQVYGFRGMAAFELERVRRCLELCKEFDMKWNATVASLKTDKQTLLKRLDIIRQNPEVFISIEGINEPDRDGLTDAEIAKTIEYQRIIREYVSSHPEMSHIAVLSPALRKPAGPAIYERFAKAGMKPDLYDKIAFHYYLTGPPNVKELSEHMDMIEEFWKLGIFDLTETGGTTATASKDPRRASEPDLAAWAVQTLFEYGSEPRLDKIMRYEAMDGKGGITNNEACFGLWRFEGSPKPEVAEIDNWIIANRYDGERMPAERVEVEVLSNPDNGVHAKLINTLGAKTLWLWRPGTDSNTTGVEVQINTPRGSKTVNLDGYPEGVSLP